jgi:multidrug transporter EmrE-like cation transporter
MAAAAYSLLSLGFVMMKHGIDWLGWKGPRTKVFYQRLVTWTAGFIIMNIYGVPSAVALKRLPPHIVSAFAGWGIIMLVVFSFLLLKEKIYPGDYLFFFLVVTGIFFLNYFEPPAAPASVANPRGIIALCAAPLLLFLPGLRRSLPAKIKTVIFASVSGMSAGLMVVSLRLLVLRFGFEIAQYPGSLYLYLYIAFALLSFIALQLALKTGSMMTTGPVQYSSNIIYPVFSAFLVFDRPLHIVQVAAIGLVVYAVVNILKKH